MGDIAIHGGGSCDGGEYGRVTINGGATIRGDITCDSISVNGAVGVRGGLTCRNFNVNGACTIDGGLRGGSGEINGSLKCSESIRADKVTLRGSLKVKGSLEAEQFISHGAFEISELLSADTIEIRFSHKASAEEVGGKSVLVRMRPESDLWGLLPRNSRFSAKLIEGDEIDLENTVCDTVRGVTVRIGPGCRIKKLEYKSSCDISPYAEVAEQSAES